MSRCGPFNLYMGIGNKDNNENNNKNLNIVNLFPRLISFQSAFYVMDSVDYIGIYVSI